MVEDESYRKIVIGLAGFGSLASSLIHVLGRPEIGFLLAILVLTSIVFTEPVLEWWRNSDLINGFGEDGCDFCGGSGTVFHIEGGVMWCPACMEGDE